jgi:hypothetical protein
MKQPLAKFRAGSVSAALWENEATINGQKRTLLKATVERRYKTEDGSWKSSNSFSRNEIPLAIFCLARAFDKIVGEEQNNAVPEEVVR